MTPPGSPITAITAQVFPIRTHTKAKNMSSQRLESSTTTVYAQSPRLFGVPVPQRAFGFDAGWCHDVAAGEIVCPEPTETEGRYECSAIDPGTVLAHDSWRSARNVSSITTRQDMPKAMKTAGQPTGKQNLKIEPEVAAA